jgi:hypothetical protein
MNCPFSLAKLLYDFLLLNRKNFKVGLLKSREQDIIESSRETVIPRFKCVY